MLAGVELGGTKCVCLIVLDAWSAVHGAFASLSVRTALRFRRAQVRVLKPLVLAARISDFDGV